MPFKSVRQMKYMYANMPALAKKWEDKYGVSKKMPKKMSKTAKKLMGFKV